MALLCLAWSHSQTEEARGTSLGLMPCQCSVWQRHHPPKLWKPHSHRNRVSCRGRITLGCRVGGISQVQQPSSLLAKAQKHFLINGAHLLPRSIHSWSMPTACMACLPAEYPQPEHEIAAVTGPRGWKLPPLASSRQSTEKWAGEALLLSAALVPKLSPSCPPLSFISQQLFPTKLRT